MENTVLFAKVENSEPTLFDSPEVLEPKSWKQCFQQMFANPEGPTEDSYWNVFYHALVRGDEGEWRPAPLIFSRHFRQEEWAVQARVQLESWLEMEGLYDLYLDFSKEQGWH